MNRLFGVPALAGPNRLKAGLQTSGVPTNRFVVSLHAEVTKGGFPGAPVAQESNVVNVSNGRCPIPGVHGNGRTETGHPVPKLRKCAAMQTAPKLLRPDTEEFCARPADDRIERQVATCARL